MFLNHNTPIAIRQFQSYVDNVLTNIKNICTSCRLFISSGNLKHLDFSHQILLTAFEARVFVESDLNDYGKKEYSFFFFMICYRQVIELKPPNFGFISQINVCTCQSYSDVFTNLILVKEAVNTHTHPVISILKLRPIGTSLSVSYQRVQGYAVILP